MSQIVVERNIDLESERAALWCAVSDAERLNRAIGLGRQQLEPNSDASAARFVVHTVSAGLPLEYEERPFEWIENRCFSVRRVLHSGVMKSMQHSFTLEPRPKGGSTLSVRLVIEPRYALLGLLIRLQTARMADRIEAEFKSVDRDLRAGQGVCFRIDHTPVDGAALARGRGARSLRR